MRQYFDIGDLVETTHPVTSQAGIVIDKAPINTSIKYPTDLKWHSDEYKCKIQFLFPTPETRWVRAKWLIHLSKINN